ncbi:MAG: DUF3604 domain-containing protein [Verrucomicrobiales bacterium]
MTLPRLWLIAVFLTGASAPARSSADWVLNPAPPTSDTHPAAVQTADGGLWLAWHGYDEGSDGVYARRISPDGAPTPVVRLSEAGTVHGPPSIALAEDGKIAVAWAAQQDGRWRVLERIREGDDWSPAKQVSPASADAIHPAIASTFAIAWSELRDGRFRIAVHAGDRTLTEISSETVDAFRPALAIDADGETWLAWDEYDGSFYRAMARRILPEPGPARRLSAEGVNGLSVVLRRTADTLAVAWLEKKDVVGGAGAGAGAISQWHTLHAATLAADGDWQPVLAPDGTRAGAELTQGLMARIEPKPAATGGYLGRRTTPMLLEADGETWLLWERKSDHGDVTPRVTGDLVGRPFKEGTWGEPIQLLEEQVDYHLCSPHRAEYGKFPVVCSDLPANQRRVYHRLIADLREGTEFVQDEWTGWEDVSLPVKSELTPRQSLEVDGQTYQLYWADLHCHSGLTTDAEGEHDELTAYARDRARLDVAVFTNNDFLYDTFLTEYEFALGNFFANTFTREGTFLSLPGYEWTSRVPGEPGASLSDPGNWTHPNRNRSYPNHRSVIYPPGGGPLVRFPEVANDIGELNRAVKKAGGVTLSQHGAFLLSGHEVEVGLELTTGWRNYIRLRPALFHDALKEGVRLGFTANGDSHRRAPGLSGALTGIYAEELTVDAVLDALRQRRCFATSGSRISIDSRANGTFMGRETRAPDGNVTLDLRAAGTRPIVSAVLVRNGEEIHRVDGEAGRELRTAHEVRDLPSGEHWFYWRVTQEGEAPPLPGNVEVAHGTLAWSTPVWVTVP